MPFPDARPAAPDTDRSPTWHHTATRWTQLTFTDDDPVTFDIDFWINVMRESRSNALCLSAGGYMAFYPTTIPFHHRSAHLGDTDPFGALVEAARRLDMHVMARVDPHAIHQDAADAHPEWLARDRDGQPIPHPSHPGLWWTDPFSTYHRDFITAVAREIVSNYDVDALFANRWEGHGGPSYATTTAEAFAADTGYRLPSTDDPDDPAWPAYAAWRSRRLSELVVRWDDAVRAVRPHVRFIPNRGAMLTRDLVRELVDDRYPMFFVDKQGRSGLEAAWTSGRIGKRTRGLFPDRPVALISSVGPEHGDLRWKDSVTDPHELRSWIVGGFAQGARPWFTKFKARCFDTRWVDPMVEVFRLHEKCEATWQDLRFTADVAILDNRQPAAPPTGSPAPHPTAHEDGFYQALVEARIPFEYIADEALSAERLAGIRLLVLPACANLTPAQLGVLEEFVGNGGSLVAAYDSTAVPDGNGGRKLALGDVFGATLRDDVRGPVKNNYLRIARDHQISAGYDGAERIVGGTHLLRVEAAESDVVFRFVPDYPHLPMEEVYPRPGEEHPAVVARTHPSGGRTVYLAFDLGRIFWQALQSDHGRLIANSVRWALGDEPPRVQVRGAGMVDIAVREGDQELAVTLVNLTNPMAMRGQNRETLPLADQQVLVRLPEGVTSVDCRLVVADRPVDAEISHRTARITVPRIDLLEVIHLRWRTPDPVPEPTPGPAPDGRDERQEDLR